MINNNDTIQIQSERDNLKSQSTEENLIIDNGIGDIAKNLMNNQGERYIFKSTMFIQMGVCYTIEGNTS